jgi:hypothetical protein
MVLVEADLQWRLVEADLQVGLIIPTEVDGYRPDV